MNGRKVKLDEIKKYVKNNIFHWRSAHAIGGYTKSHVNAGIAGSFSFSMPKLITMGQGGAVITNKKN